MRPIVLLPTHGSRDRHQRRVAVERLAARGAAPSEALAPLLASIGEEDVAIPVIVYAELLVGVELADTERRATTRRRRIEALMAHATLVEFDAAIAPVWARLFSTLSRSGRTVPANDLTVAATAVHLDYGVPSVRPMSGTSARSRGSGSRSSTKRSSQRPAIPHSSRPGLSRPLSSRGSVHEGHQGDAERAQSRALACQVINERTA